MGSELRLRRTLCNTKTPARWTRKERWKTKCQDPFFPFATFVGEVLVRHPRIPHKQASPRHEHLHATILHLVGKGHLEGHGLGGVLSDPALWVFLRRVVVAGFFVVVVVVGGALMSHTTRSVILHQATCPSSSKARSVLPMFSVRLLLPVRSFTAVLVLTCTLPIPLAKVYSSSHCPFLEPRSHPHPRGGSVPTKMVKHLPKLLWFTRNPRWSSLRSCNYYPRPGAPEVKTATSTDLERRSLQLHWHAFPRRVPSSNALLVTHVRGTLGIQNCLKMVM